MTKLSPISVCRQIAVKPPDALIRIYSIQTLSARNYLEENGTLRCTQEALERHSDYAGVADADPWKRRAYDWMSKQLRMTNSGHFSYPVWAWIKRPSLRGKERRVYHGEFLITATVPRSRILISDYDQCHNCLMGAPVTINERESNHFDELEKTSDETTWIDLMQSTWYRIFEFSSMPGEQPYWRLRGRTVLQACIDEIRKDEIVKIRLL